MIQRSLGLPKEIAREFGGVLLGYVGRAGGRGVGVVVGCGKLLPEVDEIESALGLLKERVRVRVLSSCRVLTP